MSKITVHTSRGVYEAKPFETLDLEIIEPSSENQSEESFLQALAEAQTLLPEDLEEDDLDKRL